MELSEKREILAESPLFDNLLPPELAMVAELFSLREFDTGEVVFHQGDVGNTLYVVAEGVAEIVIDGAPIAEVSAPQFFGEMSLIDKEYRSATVRAKEPLRILELTNDNLHIFAKHYRNGLTWVIVNIARVLSTRLREVNKRLAEASAGR